MSASSDAQELRATLKQWEHDFFALHGRKPARADIKPNREIAGKYKLYDQLTRKPAASKSKEKRRKERDGEVDEAKKQSPKGSKRKRDNGVGINIFADDSATPRKSSRRSGGGTKENSLQATSLDPYDPPLNNFFSPAALRTYVGPTPQKNGKVLGLFDLLSPESARKSAVAMTPSRRNGSNNVLLNSLQGQTSPSKNAIILAATPSSRSRMGPPAQTPSKDDRASDYKGILTPSRSRANLQLQKGENTRESENLLAKLMTPSTQRAKKLDLEETPEFLKRRRSPGFRPSTGTDLHDISTDRQDEGAEGRQVKASDDADGLMNISWSPIAVRQPRRPIGRSFSQIIRANRKAEEEKYEDDLDVLRELEQNDNEDDSGYGVAGNGRRKSATTPRAGSNLSNEPLGTDISPEALAAAKRNSRSRLSATDSNVTAPHAAADYLPLGADGEIETNCNSNEDDGRSGINEGQPQLRRFKKKGPKRQTRKFNLAPRTAKWQPEPEWTAGMESEDDQTESEDEAGQDEAEPDVGSECQQQAEQFQYEHDVPAVEPIQVIGSTRSQSQWADVPSDVEDNFNDSAYGGSSDKFSSPTGSGLPRKVTKLGSGTKHAVKPTSLSTSTAAVAAAVPGKSTKQVDAEKEKSKAKAKAKAGQTTKTTEKKKMVSATAHANYRTLRIKNRNSKAKRGGRFGRRRG